MITWVAFVALVKKHWRKILIGLGIIVILSLVISVYQSCKPEPKIDEKGIQEAIVAIEQKNDKKLREILAESDARVEAAESNTNVAREQVKEAAQRDYGHMTTQELADEIERRSRE